MWLTNLKVAAIGLAVILSYTAVAHMIPQLESEVPEALDLSGDVTPEALVAAGEQVYNGAGGCTACHGLGTRAPNLLTGYDGQGPIGARCQEAFGDACKEYLHTSLVNPGDSVVPPFVNIMPNMQQQLGDPQAVWAVVAFLQSLGGEVTVTADDIPEAERESGRAGEAAGGPAAGPRVTATEPRAMMQELGCFTCHAIDGEGPPIGPSFDAMGSRISADRIRRGILEPNAEIAEGFEQFAGVMLATFGDQLTAAQLEAIVRFLAGRR
jgi:mono/diheme cytochrome c family protein